MLLKKYRENSLVLDWIAVIRIANTVHKNRAGYYFQLATGFTFLLAQSDAMSKFCKITSLIKLTE